MLLRVVMVINFARPVAHEHPAIMEPLACTTSDTDCWYEALRGPLYRAQRGLKRATGKPVSLAAHRSSR